MTNKKDPFNLELLFLKKEQYNKIGEVKDLSIFETSTNNFNPDGLFSTEIFGRVGSDERLSNYGYINLNIKVLHPLIFKHISSLKKLYSNIMLGTTYAKFDKELKDFVISNASEGDTGYEFFLSKFDKIELKDNGSDARLFKIKLIKKYKLEELTLDKFLVLPAGLRDYVVDDSGKPSEDEVNDLYRKLLTSVNTLKNTNTLSNDLTLLDPIRIKIQNNIVALYDHFISLMDGKKKFIQGKWSKRAIRDSTRNVLTPMPSNITDLTKVSNGPTNVNVVLGIYQYSKAINPITKYNLKNKILLKIFDQHSNNATLVDKKSLSSINVEIKSRTRDDWLSESGLDNIVNKLAQEELRSEPVYVEGYYLAMVYDDGKRVKVVTNTNELPENIDKKHLRPLTYVEMLYLSVYKDVNKYPAFVTRYPVSNVGGIYPCIPYLKTTVKGREVEVLNDMWEVEDVVYEYPILGETSHNSISVSVKQLQRMGADLSNCY